MSQGGLVSDVLVSNADCRGSKMLFAEPGKMQKNVSDNKETWRACCLRDWAWGLSLLPQAARSQPSVLLKMISEIKLAQLTFYYMLKFPNVRVRMQPCQISNLLSSNVLHSSGPNASLDRRWNLVLAYNQVSHKKGISPPLVTQILDEILSWQQHFCSKAFFKFCPKSCSGGKRSDRPDLPSSSSTALSCRGRGCACQGQVGFLLRQHCGN